MSPQRPRRRIIIAVASAACLLAGLTAPGAAAAPASKFTASPLGAGEVISVDLSKAARAADGRVGIIVKLTDDSVAQYRGGVAGLRATNPRARGQLRLDLKSPDTAAYRAHLKSKQDAFIGAAKRVTKADVTQRTDVVLNAVGLVVNPDDVGAIAKLPGVAAVYPDSLQKPTTDRSPSFIGATNVWQELGGQSSAGEGVIVGVLDTGIWPEHPSFSDPDPAGKPYAAPPAASDGARACDFSGGANPGAPFTCNNKLIGASRFMATYDSLVGLQPGEFTSARDDDGHGTHTSSTAAGNGGVAASIFGVPRGVVSGIAPRAQVEMFKVCGEQGCFDSDSVAAVQEAIEDGVNVINFSISGGSQPFADAVELAFLDAYEADVFVAASAGNSGPTPETVDHRGPWVTTVAASTHTRAFLNTVELAASGGAALSLQGTSLTGGVGPAPLMMATGDGLCGPVAAGTYTGKVVICARGNYGRAEKGKNVLDAGGVGMILYNQSAAVTDLETDNHYLPTSHIQFAQGEQVRAFLTAHPDATATITAGVAGSAQGDVMASFSSRGGPQQNLGVSKPDITAPGVQILAGASPQHVGVAGGPQGELFQAIAGTSMASPHVAGAAALLRDLRPTWTPGQIKSALMTTARTSGLVKEDGSTPFNAFDAGSGRVDLTVADDPGLTFAAAASDFVANKNKLSAVNGASIYVPALPGQMTLTRTAHSVLPTASQWKLTARGTADFAITVPKSISVGSGGDATFSIGLDATKVPMGETRFGMITLAQQKGGTRVLHIPVTIVRRQTGLAFAKTCDPLALAPGASTACTVTATNANYTPASFTITDKLPSKLKLDTKSVVGGTVVGKDTVTASGTIAAAQPATVSIAAGGSPAGGYLPLSLFGIGPIGGMTDDTLVNFNVPAFTYAGQTYTRLGVGSNGYLVVGGGTGSDVSISNQAFPNPIAPNNVLAGFWTDLNPSAGGTVRIGTLTDGGDTWIVVDWDAVREFSSAANTHSFQMWLGVSTDANPGTDVSYAYGPNTGNGDGGFATVGAENADGSSGGTTYFNGTGTLPSNGTQLVVTSAAGATSKATVTFTAKAGDNLGSWTNCATLTSNAFEGTGYSCVTGSIG